jgi:hypothetical protein
VLGVSGALGLGSAATAKDPMRSRIPQFDAPPPLVDLTKEQLRSAWEDLADPTKVEATVRLLATGKQTVSLLSEHMKPGAAPPEPAQIDRPVEGLQSARFEIRQAAALELERIGPVVERALRKVLEDRPPLEVSRRIELILARFPIVQCQFRNGLRTLMLVGSPSALALLVTLTRGHSSAWQTSEALATCERIRTASWYMLINGPAQAYADFEQELLKKYWEDLKNRPPNAR